MRTIADGIRTLSVTSALPKEGVSTIAEALVKRSQASGQRSLLVELNLFRPHWNKRLNREASAWLPSDPSPIEHAVIQQEGYSILPASSSPNVAMNFREQAVLQDAINRWLKLYDIIIFDTSPVNANNQGNIPADIICHACEGTLIVVRAGRTTETAVREAKNKLLESNCNLLGSVINDQDNPCLAQEIIRETFRFETKYPKLSAWLRLKINQSALLNAPI